MDIVTIRIIPLSEYIFSARNIVDGGEITCQRGQLNFIENLYNFTDSRFALKLQFIEEDIEDNHNLQTSH